MIFKLPRFDRSIPIVKKDGTPTLPFHGWWQQILKKIESAINGIQDALIAAGIAIEAAEDAQTAADAAQTAADAAQAAADAAEGTGEGAERIASLTNSGTIGLTVTASDAGSDATITISAHTRAYGNGTSVAVDGGSLTGLLYSTYYYIYYDDPSRAGGSVTYAVTTSEVSAVQTGDRHLVGAVTTPAALDPDTGGQVVRPPGVGSIDTP